MQRLTLLALGKDLETGWNALVKEVHEDCTVM